MRLETLLEAAPTTTRWLFEGQVGYQSPATMIRDYMDYLNRDGFQILRSNTLFYSLHPQIASRFFRWWPKQVNEVIPLNQHQLKNNVYDFEGSVVTEVSWGYGAINEDAFSNSPWRLILGERKTVHRHLNNESCLEFSIFSDLINLGITDYVGFPLELIAGESNAISFGTTKPDGFSSRNVAVLKYLTKQWMLNMEPYQAHAKLRTLLSTYLGRNAGSRVLDGQIRRGDVEQIESAIWFLDFRDFAALSNALDPSELIAVLNTYFASITTLITDHGGEILKFIGDAILAIFPVTDERDRARVCSDALLSARQVNTALAELKLARETEGLPVLRHGIGLHFGNAQYGNIGSDDRLDFTVIGQAVNLASRTEGLCARLGRQTLVTEIFMRLAETDLEYVGEFELKGFDGATKIYAL